MYSSACRPALPRCFESPGQLKKTKNIGVSPKLIKCKIYAYFSLNLAILDTYRLVWAKKVTLAAICLEISSASFGIRIN